MGPFIDILFLDNYERVRHHLSLKGINGGYVILKFVPITNRAHRYNILEPIYDCLLNFSKSLRVELNEKMVYMRVVMINDSSHKLNGSNRLCHAMVPPLSALSMMGTFTFT